MKGQGGGVKQQTLGRGRHTPTPQGFFTIQYSSTTYYCHFSKICKPVLLPTRQVVDFSLKEIKYLWRFANLSLSAANSNTVSASRTTAAWPGWLLFRKSLALDTVLDTLLLILKFHLSPIESHQNLINLLVVNFEGTWSRDFGKIIFHWVLFSQFHKANMKKGTKFCNSMVLNLILVFNLLNFLKYQDEMKQAKQILMFFHDRRHSHQMESTIKVVL